MNNIANAYSEVYEILSYLPEEDFEKIPQELIEVLLKNKNDNYAYEVNSNLDLTKQEMLPETRAILYNIFRDYLATDEQREKIKKWQEEEKNCK